MRKVSLCQGALRTCLKVANTGGAPFTFTCALHTYFACGALQAPPLSRVRTWMWEALHAPAHVPAQPPDCISGCGGRHRVPLRA
mgnify:FL=1